LHGSFSAYRPCFLQILYVIDHPLRLDGAVFVGGHLI